MTKYIDREALIEWLKRIPLKDLSDGLGLCRVIMEDDFKKAIKEMPKSIIVDAAPVRHGHWIIGVDNDDFDIKCSKCKWTDTFEVAGIAAVERIAKAMHYCPNCGARMDGGE